MEHQSNNKKVFDASDNWSHTSAEIVDLSFLHTSLSVISRASGVSRQSASLRAADAAGQEESNACNTSPVDVRSRFISDADFERRTCPEWGPRGKGRCLGHYCRKKACIRRSMQSVSVGNSCKGYSRRAEVLRLRYANLLGLRDQYRTATSG